jgi:hypothetical protein
MVLEAKLLNGISFVIHLYIRLWVSTRFPKPTFVHLSFLFCILFSPTMSMLKLHRSALLFGPRAMFVDDTPKWRRRGLIREMAWRLQRFPKMNKMGRLSCHARGSFPSQVPFRQECGVKWVGEVLKIGDDR